MIEPRTGRCVRNYIDFIFRLEAVLFVSRLFQINYRTKADAKVENCVTQQTVE